MKRIDISNLQKGMEAELLQWVIDTVYEYSEQCDKEERNDYQIGKKDAYENVLDAIRTRADILSE
ncbi:MAG: hypothetical protein PUC59_08980 [Firmicutes bacterium]|nr:hypothetical protein [Bacillota bacterium]